MLPEFATQISDLYEHLYDLVYLRNHALLEQLVPDPSPDRKERAWQLHQVLLEAIAELNPGPEAPAYSREWRRHRLMVLRYVDGLDPPTVADRLSISRRQYYRDHEEAIEAVTSVLWDKAQKRPALPATAPAPEPIADRLEILRLEVARLAQDEQRGRLPEVLPGVLALLQTRLRQHGLETTLVLREALPPVALDQGLLRQILLSILGYVAERAGQATIRLEAQAYSAAVRLSLRVEPPTALQPATAAEVQERMSAWQDLARLTGVAIALVGEPSAPAGLDLVLPTGPQRTVLVVDDNQDVLELFQRYLALSRYRVVTAATATQALELARQVQPHAITLDLMMPGQDGWEVLQTLLNQPETCRIPVIVCSVLPEKELALSLGASTFLKKPVSEQSLLAALVAIERDA